MHFSHLLIILICHLVFPALSIPLHNEGEHCFHSTTTLLQTTRRSAILLPVGRSFLSSDVEASAQFFIDNFQAKLAKQNTTEDLSCAEAVSVEWGTGIIFTFVKDKVLPHGLMLGTTFIDGVSAQWKAIKEDNLPSPYTRWIDNHDGFNFDNTTFFDTLAFSAGTGLVQKGSVFSRLQVPRTVWNVELSGDEVFSATAELSAGRVVDAPFADDNVCRVPTSGVPVSEEGRLSPLFWWKSTMASADPETAAAFSAKYLFGTRIDSDYPLGGNCTLATWVRLPGTLFQLHFAQTSPHYTPHPSVDDWVQQQDLIRHLEAGMFDQFMHNNLILWTNDLDPFVQQLQIDGQPFMTLKNGNLFSLFVSIPKNSLVFQIRSDHLTSKPSGTFNSCGVRSVE